MLFQQSYDMKSQINQKIYAKYLIFEVSKFLRYPGTIKISNSLKKFEFLTFKLANVFLSNQIMLELSGAN